MEEKDVPIGQWVAAEGPVTLAAQGVGSCLVLTLYDRKRRSGALAHAMLPTANGASKETENNSRYVDRAVREMLQRMLDQGSQRGDLQAKIAGGANMFDAPGRDIGKENVSSAKEALRRENVSLVAECVGGANGRSIEFCVTSGVMTIKTKL
ncbi:MAG: hypothetical protein AMS16_00495 [Planctomycetes bacterium DG_58]|nr:MAG: hypothetical protein AMS16_00495 [Planctomycetes bacterium DG_58]KPL03245.1 MAG: hypothetical protein AMK75_01715 [Planctomycetes bacterium SM23_65]